MYHLDDRAAGGSARSPPRAPSTSSRGPDEDGARRLRGAPSDGWTRQLSVSRRRNAERTSGEVRAVRRARPHARAAGVFQDRGARRRSDDVRAAAGVHRHAARQRLQRRAVHGAAAAQGRISVRHARHDAAGRAVRRHDRAARRDVRRRHRHRAGDRLLADDERICGGGAGGWMSPMLAAWAPNILFGAAAVYMLLTVRT